MSGFETIRDLLAIGKNDATAIGAPKRTGQNYAVLRELADTTVARLNELGVGRNDRVAIVLPNSPEMAAAFVTIGCGATTAPLNPAYRREEFDFYLDDLAARALVVEEGSESPALSAA
ncbi:MAG: AMP-binding protein, partial [Pseudomonadota bacterium]|nr:AMP-binding protein [Pseudomonadota bacterium]